MSQLIQRGDVGTRIARFLGLRGRGQVSAVHSQVVPVLIVDNLNEREHDYNNVRWAAGTFTCPASAGQNSRISLTNPAASGVLARIRYISLYSAAGGEAQVLCESGNAAIPTIITYCAGWLDSRLRKNPTDIPLLVPSYQYSAGQGVPMYVRNVPAGGFTEIEEPGIVLAAAQRLLLEARIQNNVDWRMGVVWTEENAA